jgi:hypothetical protein
MAKLEIDQSDLLKLKDVLESNVQFHKSRDEMNGAVHLAKTVRHSPLTSETIAAYERLVAILHPGIAVS